VLLSKILELYEIAANEQLKISILIQYIFRSFLDYNNFFALESAKIYFYRKDQA